MFNELSQNDITILTYINYFYRFVEIIGGVWAVRCLITLLQWVLEKIDSNKSIRYGVFLIDGFCFFRFLSGLFLIRFCNLLYYFGCLKEPKVETFLDSFIYYLIGAGVFFVLSYVLKRESDIIYREEVKHESTSDR